jgi:hypothetical protein
VVPDNTNRKNKNNNDNHEEPWRRPIMATATLTTRLVVTDDVSGAYPAPNLQHLNSLTSEEEERKAEEDNPLLSHSAKIQHFQDDDASHRQHQKFEEHSIKTLLLHHHHHHHHHHQRVAARHWLCLSHFGNQFSELAWQFSIVIFFTEIS